MNPVQITPKMVAFARNLKTVPKELNEVLWQVPDRCSGKLTLGNTRFRMECLLEHLEGGGTMEEFKDWYTGANEVMPNAEKVLEYLSKKVI